LEVLPSRVGNEDEDIVASSTVVGIVVGSNTIAGNGAVLGLNSRDGGASVGWISSATTIGLNTNADGKLVGEKVETVSRLLQKGDCGCIH
jgi:hypothetical protein